VSVKYGMYQETNVNNGDLHYRNTCWKDICNIAIESQPSKMKYHTVGKVPKYNRKIVETQKQKSMLATHIDDNDRIQWDYKF
jgi:hypothetical protein